MAQEQLEAALARLLSDGAVGELDVRDGRRRWVFSLEEGQILLTRSNLKSEGGDALKAAHPKAGRNELIRIQTATRLSGALKALHATWSFTEKPASAKRMDIPTYAIFIEALAGARAIDLARQGLVGDVAGVAGDVRNLAHSGKGLLEGDELRVAVD